MGNIEAVKSKVASIENDLKYHKQKLVDLRLEWEVWTDKLSLLEDEKKSENNGGEDSKPEVNEDNDHGTFTVKV